MLGIAPGYRSEIWTSFAVAGATLGIHQVTEVPEPGRVVLSLVAEEPLEDVIARLAASGIEPEAGIKEEPFGRSFVVRDPDGSAVQVNEHAG